MVQVPLGDISSEEWQEHERTDNEISADDVYL